MLAAGLVGAGALIGHGFTKSRAGGLRQPVYFVILPHQAAGISEESQVEKTVRVATTVDYYLKD